ncbi:anhydro-N-acetylmuramic acid kinase [Undibacterium sp. SXout7W]|uniref:anhydro-N-acetylmuramic acid kinase n=1 Tax=Undibacterium sp. SXout7W TaxID=3413049 RepID=UPI003BF2E8A2
MSTKNPTQENRPDNLSQNLQKNSQASAPKSVEAHSAQTQSAACSSLYIGLMSGTSLDGVDGVLVRLSDNGGEQMRLLASAYLPFSPSLRQQALALQQPGENEIMREALLANELAAVYADCVQALLDKYPDAAGTDSAHPANHGIRAIGVHGQTIRHRPELGFTRQTNQPALLAEMTNIDVIADFRSRDIAAGGQGAPLVPAFHRAVFGVEGECRVVVNIGGISNISILAADGSTRGFDTGPGNVLMDAWMQRHQQKNYDAGGQWASQGKVIDSLLFNMLSEAYLQVTPPKSTGRDLFHLKWLLQHLDQLGQAFNAVDIQATLSAYTATTLANAIMTYAENVQQVLVCGGGAANTHLMQGLQSALRQAGSAATVSSTAVAGVEPEQVEALAFAWLAQQFCLRRPGNLPDVTGAKGYRILGALYPA